MTDHILNGDNIIKVDVACDVGMVRQNNEDMILVGGEFVRDSSLRQIYELSSQARFAAIVADGMGGHNGGEVASEFVLHQLDDYLMDLPAELSESELSDALRYWAKNTHRLLIEQSHERPECEGMGTTLCGLLFYEKMVFAVNIGDSRLYRWRGDVLKQMSADHSMKNLVGGDKTVPSNQIYNSLGAGVDTFIDIKNLSSQLYEDDVFLICSDGLNDMVSDEQIEQVLLQPDCSASILVDQAKQAGGKDNISVILLTISRFKD